MTVTRTFDVDLTLPLEVNAVAGNDTINISEWENGFTIRGETGTIDSVTVAVSIGGEALTDTTGIAGGGTNATWSLIVPGSANITEPSVSLSVTATLAGYVSTTVTRTLSVDLTAPTVSYAAPSSLKVDEAITSITPTTTHTDIDSYTISSGSLPPGLLLNGTTGVLSGAPTMANDSTQTVEVLATDDAGNETETPATITFPAVAKGDQTLEGFGYSPSRIAYGAPRPTLDTPPGARTPVTYSAVPDSVCTVVSSTGRLSIEGGGICTITASAEGDDNYSPAADTSFVQVARVSVSKSNLEVPEGGSANYTVVLDLQPTDGVRIAVERRSGDLDLSADRDTLIFTDSNWNTPQMVTISAAEDVDSEHGIATFSHNADSDDTEYDGIGIFLVTATEGDNDEAGVTVSPTTVRVPEGGSASYTMKLDTEPADMEDVTIYVLLPGTADPDLTVSTDELLFTNLNWSTPQTVTIFAAEDADSLSDSVTIEHSLASNDEDYNDDEMTVEEVTAIEADNEKEVTVEIQTMSARVGGAFDVTILFSEPVAGFEQSEISVTNGEVTAFSGLGTTYEAEITPSAEGEVKVEVRADVVEYGVGNGNQPAAPLVVEADLTGPEVAITSEASALVGGAFEVTITFSEAVTGFGRSGITVTNGSATGFGGSGTTYTARITPWGSGEARVEVGADVAEDDVGNGNLAATPFIIDVDLTGPNVEITSDAAVPVTGRFEVTITFSEEVTGFNRSEITVTNGSVTGFGGSGTTYTAEITPSESGEVRVEVGADVAEDEVGHGNRAATPFIIEAYLTRPEVEITRDETGPVGGAFEVTITFSEAVTGFERSEITVTNGEVTGFSGSGTTYTAEITPSESGEVRVEVGADVAENAAGNGNQAPPPFIIEVDLTRPDVEITSDAAVPVTGRFEVTITFSEPVTGFEQSEIRVGNGTVADFTEVSPSVYDATIAPAGAGPPVVVEVPENIAEDGVGNGNDAAAPLIVETAVEVSFAEASYRATEGAEAATVTVKLSQAGGERLAIPIRVTRPETTEAGDYGVEGLEDWDAREGTGTLAFAAGETERTWRIVANHDGDGDDETVALGFGELPEFVMTGEPSVATVTLKDKGLVELQVSFSQAAYEVREGQGADIEVTISPAADRRVEVALVAELQGGTTPEDYNHGGLPASVVFEEGASRETISIEVLADEVNDPGEGIVLSLDELPEAVSGADPSSTEVRFMQWRTATQFSRSLEGMLAVIARSMGESARNAIEGRFERHRQWSRLGSSGGAIDDGGQAEQDTLQVAGEALAAEALAALEPGWDGARQQSNTPASWLLNVLPGSLGKLARPNQVPTGASASSGVGPSQSGYDQMRPGDPGTRHTGSAEDSAMPGLGLSLSGASFEMALGKQETQTSWVPVLWGQGDVQRFDGDLARLGMNYRGGLDAGHVGLDLHASERMLAGLSFMRSWGNLDYNDDGVDGVLGSTLNTVHPYLYWQPNERVSLWGIGGWGRGQVDVTEPGRIHDFEAGFRMFAGGVRAALRRRGNTEWGLRADAFTAELETDAVEDIAGVSGEAHRGRLMLDWVHDGALSAGRSLSVKVEAGGRFDQGDADAGAGVETGLRLGYLDANNGLDVALHGRVLVVHESDYRDWGVGVQASWDPGEKQRGFGVSVTSSWGRDGGGRTTLWDNADAVTHPAGMGALGLGSQYRLESEVAYAGAKAPGLPVLLAPYSRLRWTGQGRELAVGTAWSLAARPQFALPATFELEGVRRESKTGRSDYGLLLRMSIPF
ncbi:Ig-like domain-containing protein [Candidatus Palauibacter sp.]|uniref:Ig-like domain-containing protein n=1 Tax=Candidatus Palauibacter sp. TaxID=3101350 RepID=UPI003CC600E9